MRDIVFFLPPHFVALDVTGPLEVFAVARALMAERGGNGDAYRIEFVGLDAGPVTGTAGIQFVVGKRLESALNVDTLIVPGSMPMTLIADQAFLDRFGAVARTAGRLVSVCNGAMVLAACGLLDGRKATTHWMLTDEMARKYPRIDVDAGAIFVRDGHVYTSAGVTAGIDLALHLVEEDYGGDLAMEIARILVLYRRRPGSQAQFSSPLRMESRVGREFHSLFRWLQANIRDHITVEDMAARVGMSPRNFARVFRQKTGLTPGTFLEDMRLDLARELLEGDTEVMSDIAELAGFMREDRMRRVFQKKLGVTPAQYRFHFLNHTPDNKEIHS